MLALIRFIQYIDIDLFIPIYRQSALTIMRKIRCLLVSMLLATVVSTLAGSEPTVQTSPAPEDKNSRDLFSWESTYTASSDFRGDESKLGDGDSFYGDFSYDHGSTASPMYSW